MQLFCAEPILDDSLAMPSFLVMQQHGIGSAVRNTPVSQLLTKSATFSAFLQAGTKDETDSNEESVRLLMEPLLKPAEWVGMVEGLRNIHPPEPMDAPGRDPATQQRCQRLVDSTLRQNSAAQVSDGNITRMVYYLRASKVNAKTCRSVADFLTKEVPSGLVRGWEVYPEWITDNVGGYRIEVQVDSARAEQLSRKNAD